MRKVTLTESDLKRIIHRILEQNETPSNEGDMDRISMKATTDHIMQVYKSLLDDIDYVKTERDKTQNSNLTQKDKDYLVGAWNRVLEVIHEDTRPPSQEEDQDY
jgi:hypothetical protein